ncbi:hypothetical protein H7347_00080 [Corynebacterium sp. zg-331]|uniref:hypothetical protein n=1 Tax=unclassified Corynebacterium TaxID=2624378 RepID=UPI00128DE677|nr:MULTISPECIES: hypothetical protein [unclassified Corynebacterium]MBC3184997.1 hypothetical protein [Corynebacterium sp. zg-331]MPV51499.1 hypothetical protein [Corynebacterium sp. zg331]
MTSHHGGEDREPATRSFPAQSTQGDYAEFPRVAAKAGPEAVGPAFESRRPRFESSNSSMIAALAAMFFVLVLVGAGTWIFLFSSGDRGREPAVAAPMTAEETGQQSTVRTTSAARTTAARPLRTVESRRVAAPSSAPRRPASSAVSSARPRATSAAVEPTTPRASLTSTPPTSLDPPASSQAPAIPAEATPVNAAARAPRTEGRYQRVWASGATSEDFAQVVHRQWLSEYQQTGRLTATVRAYSPTTGKTYTMNCRDAGEYVHCTGGNNANVYIG